MNATVTGLVSLRTVWTSGLMAKPTTASTTAMAVMSGTQLQVPRLNCGSRRHRDTATSAAAAAANAAAAAPSGPISEESEATHGPDTTYPSASPYPAPTATPAARAP